MSSELDLHGFQVVEAIDTFVNYYNDRVHNGDFSRILVIHGYGSTGEGGKIRVRLRNFLANHESFLAFECGEHIVGGNLGNTFVFPRKSLPSTIDALSNEILEFCRSPKTKSKIAGKFRIHGEAKIQASLQILEKRKLLGVTRKGSHKLFQSVFLEPVTS
ncbi:MAG TPA: Smr/MutS family protein [Candidatus Ozemobacteraceae bacterium]|nr:Smr/MutS family protein [Candidatus Ozemobacteraceae bacterium]